MESFNTLSELPTISYSFADFRDDVKTEVGEAIQNVEELIKKGRLHVRPEIIIGGGWTTCFETFIPHDFLNSWLSRLAADVFYGLFSKEYNAMEKNRDKFFPQTKTPFNDCPEFFRFERRILDLIDDCLNADHPGIGKLTVKHSFFIHDSQKISYKGFETVQQYKGTVYLSGLKSECREVNVPLTSGTKPFGDGLFATSFEEIVKLIESHRIYVCYPMTKDFFVALYDLLMTYFNGHLPHHHGTGRVPMLWELCDEQKSMVLQNYRHDCKISDASNAFKSFVRRVIDFPEAYGMTHDQMVELLKLDEDGVSLTNLDRLGAMVIQTYDAIPMRDLTDSCVVKLKKRSCEDIMNGHITICDMAQIPLALELFELHMRHKAIASEISDYITTIKNYFYSLMVMASEEAKKVNKKALIVMSPFCVADALDQLERMTKIRWIDRMLSQSLGEKIVMIFRDGFSEALGMFKTHENYDDCVIVMISCDMKISGNKDFFDVLTKKRLETDPIREEPNVYICEGYDELSTAQALDENMGEFYKVFFVNQTLAEETLVRHYTGGRSNVCNNVMRYTDNDIVFGEDPANDFDPDAFKPMPKLNANAKFLFGTYLSTNFQTGTMTEHRDRIIQLADANSPK